MIAEKPINMKSYPGPTIIDVAYELLSIYGPLTVEQAAEAAADLGYQIAGWEFQAVIEEHLLINGENSLFIEIDNSRYGLMEAQEEPHHATAHLGRYLPVGIALALIAILGTSVLIGSLSLKRALKSIYLPATLVESLTQPDIAFAAEEAVLARPDATWWFDHPINQMNTDTQSIAQQLLSNHYNTCGPAVVAMLTNYFKSGKDDNLETITPADVLKDAHNMLGYYTPPYNSGLLTFQHLRSLLELYDLEQTYPAGKDSLLSLDELLERIRRGEPAIAGMRYSYQENWLYLPAGGSGLYNHFVIIFALEEIGEEEFLWVSNPHPGKYLYEDHQAAPIRISVDEFWQSWALKDGSEQADHGHAAFFASMTS
jgi:hypothetical protein